MKFDIEFNSDDKITTGWPWGDLVDRERFQEILKSKKDDIYNDLIEPFETENNLIYDINKKNGDTYPIFCILCIYETCKLGNIKHQELAKIKIIY